MDNLTPCSTCLSTIRKLICSDCWAEERVKLSRWKDLVNLNTSLCTQIDSIIKTRSVVTSTTKRRKLELECRRQNLENARSRLKHRSRLFKWSTQIVSDTRSSLNSRRLVVDKLQSCRTSMEALQHRVQSIAVPRYRSVIMQQAKSLLPQSLLCDLIASQSAFRKAKDSWRTQLALADRAVLFRHYQWIQKLRDLREVKATSEGDTILRFKECDVGLLRIPVSSGFRTCQAFLRSHRGSHCS